MLFSSKLLKVLRVASLSGNVCLAHPTANFRYFNSSSYKIPLQQLFKVLGLITEHSPPMPILTPRSSSTVVSAVFEAIKSSSSEPIST